MKKLALFLLLWCFAVPAACATDGEVLYFFENYCGSCHPESDFIEEFQNLTGKSLAGYSYRYYNVKYQDGRSAYERALAEHGLNVEEGKLPLVIVDGAVYNGSRAMQEQLPADFIAAGSPTDSVLYYLYAPACESCQKAKAVIEALPASVEVTRGMYDFSSQIVVQRIDIYEDLATAKMLFEKYRVPEDKQIAPCVFLRDTYLSGAERIETLLQRFVGAGMAVGNERLALAGEESAALPALGLIGAAAAGVVAGFNPCALSMLLFFLTAILSGRERAGRYAAAFLAAKFCAYLLIGTALLGAFRAWNPTYLPLVSKLLLTVLGGVLVVLNLLDAWNARNERYGRVKNQLPAPLRKFLHRTIQSSLDENGIKRRPGALLAAVVALGFVVAASEFLCSGQLYLAAITAGLQSGVDTARLFGLLVVFCLCFLLPSVALCAVILRGKALFAVSEWMREKMVATKIVTAILMAVMIAVAWLL